MNPLGAMPWAAAGNKQRTVEQQIADIKACLDPSRPLPADVDPSADDRAETAAEARAWCSDWTADRMAEIDENRTVRGWRG